MVLSPACDLEHSKVDVVCLIPIVGVLHYTCLSSFYGVLRSSVIGLVRTVLSEDSAGMIPKGGLPDDSSLQRLKAILHQKCVELKERERQDKQLADIARVRRFLGWIEYVTGIPVANETLPDVRKILASQEWERSRKEIVRNAFREDIFFLPRERENTPLPAVADHAVALFRYPFAVPLCVLDQAQLVPDVQWALKTDELSLRIPFAAQFRDCRPTKVLRLKPEFLHDLLTRYVRVYVRVGSPDFSDEAVDVLAAEIGN